MNLVGKYACISKGRHKERGIFPIVSQIGHPGNEECCGSIRYKTPNEEQLNVCYENPAISNVLLAILDWDKYQEDNKQNIGIMLLGKDESAKQLALEILREHNCVIR